LLINQNFNDTALPFILRCVSHFPTLSLIRPPIGIVQFGFQGSTEFSFFILRWAKMNAEIHYYYEGFRLNQLVQAVFVTLTLVFRFWFHFICNDVGSVCYL